eukprot:2265731-Amphidinium_carterae.1
MAGQAARPAPRKRQGRWQDIRSVQWPVCFACMQPKTGKPKSPGEPAKNQKDGTDLEEANSRRQARMYWLPWLRTSADQPLGVLDAGEMDLEPRGGPQTHSCRHHAAPWKQATTHSHSPTAALPRAPLLTNNVLTFLGKPFCAELNDQGGKLCLAPCQQKTTAHVCRNFEELGPSCSYATAASDRHPFSDSLVGDGSLGTKLTSKPGYSCLQVQVQETQG